MEVSTIFRTPTRLSQRMVASATCANDAMRTLIKEDPTGQPHALAHGYTRRTRPHSGTIARSCTPRLAGRPHPRNRAPTRQEAPQLLEPRILASSATPASVAKRY